MVLTTARPTPATPAAGRRRSAVRAGAVALVAGLLATGCSVQPGVAATVGDRTISQDEFERTRDGLEAIVPGAEAGQVLVAMAIAPMFLDAATGAGVGVSTAEARDVISEQQTAAGVVDAPVPSEGVVEVIQFTIAAQRLQALPEGADILAGLDDSVRSLDIDVNPRYGAFDAESGLIAPVAPSWIVQPEA